MDIWSLGIDDPKNADDPVVVRSPRRNGDLGTALERAFSGGSGSFDEEMVALLARLH